MLLMVIELGTVQAPIPMVRKVLISRNFLTLSFSHHEIDQVFRVILIVIVMEMQEKLPATNLVQGHVIHGGLVIGPLVQMM